MSGCLRDPEDDDCFSSPKYDAGKNQAVLGNGATYPGDPIYMMGYEKGTEIRNRVQGRHADEEQTDPPKHASNQPTPGQVALILSENETRKRMEDNY